MLDYRLPRLVAVRHVREHVLWLRFNDGIEGEVDLADGLRGELFAPLHDVARFAEARVEDGTLAWPNGADWAPETLRDRLGAAYRSALRSIGDTATKGLAQMSDVPEISRFYGVVIRMLANEHSPPHFHARYGEYEITVTIRDGIVTGQFPGRTLQLVLEWRDLHQRELIANWDRLRAGQPSEAIPPLA